MSSILTKMMSERLSDKYYYDDSDTIKELCEELVKARNSCKVKQRLTLSTDELYYALLLAGYEVDTNMIDNIASSTKIDFNSNLKVQFLISGYIDAFKLAKLYNLNIDTKEKLYDIWKVLTAGSCSNIDIEGETWRSQNLDNPIRGEDFIDIDKYMEELLVLYNKEPEDNVFLTAALICTIISRVSPFCDGNARLARFMALCYMIKNGVNEVLSLNISKVIYINKKEYFKTLCTTPTSRYNCTSHIECVLSLILKSYQNVK